METGRRWVGFRGGKNCATNRAVITPTLSIKQHDEPRYSFNLEKYNSLFYSLYVFWNCMLAVLFNIFVRGDVMMQHNLHGYAAFLLRSVHFLVDLAFSNQVHLGTQAWYSDGIIKRVLCSGVKKTGKVKRDNARRKEIFRPLIQRTKTETRERCAKRVMSGTNIFKICHIFFVAFLHMMICANEHTYT